MNYNNLKLIEKFDEKSLPSLTEVVLAALELFEKKGLPEVKFKNFKKPVVVGSGNAIATAKILFEGSDAIFADENNYKEAMKRNGVDGVFIFSASGAKHAPIIAKEAKKDNLNIQLITCTNNSLAQEIVGKENTIITNKNREPYTYNTSTYLGWIIAKTREDPIKIHEFIEKKINNSIPRNIGNYEGYLLVLPNEFEGLINLFNVKFVELFGRQVARDIYTYEQMKHAVTVVPNKKELAIQFGDGDFDFENDILKIPLPKKLNLAQMMAIGYYTIGKIQENKEQFFKENISSYIKRLNKTTFGKGMKVIVE